MNAKDTLTTIAQNAGIAIGGDKPQDIQVYDESVYVRVFRSGQLAVGETFMEKMWDCDDLAGALTQLIESGVFQQLRSPSTIMLALQAKLFNLQTRERAFQVGQEHYDYGNDMYRAMLGPTMVYTCADYRNANNLDDAQNAKLELICQKLQLQPGKRLLDIGCGWGSLMKYAAEQYGVKCVGISVSEEQTAYARESFGDLPCSIEIVDYRDFNDADGFDYITSIEMIEAVGPKNYRTYFKKIHNLLKPDGQVLIQSIGTADKTGTADPWIDKYIFPNGTLPSLHELVDETHGLLVFEHMEDIGRDYDQTLMDWWYNLERAYPELYKKDPVKYDERFLRMFKYYLHSCAALARTRTMYDWQIVFTKKH